MDRSGGLVCAEGCYGAGLAPCGFEPLADQITLDLRPAGGKCARMFMPGSVLWAAKFAASIRADVRVDQRRNALTDFLNLVSRTASFHPTTEAGQSCDRRRKLLYQLSYGAAIGPDGIRTRDR